jgi:hypothetical protein
MRSLLSFVRRFATPRAFAVLLVALALAMVSIHLVPTPWSLVRLRATTGGVSILDMEAHYTPSEAYARLTALGEAGRRFYLWRVLAGLDVVLPFLMALTLSAGIQLLVGGRGGSERWVLLPWYGAAADYLENLVIGSLLITFPTEHPFVAFVAGWITTLKLLLYASSTFALIGFGARRVWQSLAPHRAPGGA